MPCCSSPKVEDLSPILDIEQIMEDWVWEDFRQKSGFFRRMTMRRSKYDIDIPMNFYQFQDSEAIFKDVKTDRSRNSSIKNSGMPHMNILSTDYENDTPLEQLYKFRLERARTASVSVTFQTGFSIGGKANFSLIGNSAELETKLEVTKTTGQTFQETLTFETTSDVRVESYHHCTANVVFTERELSKQFKVITTMHMPSGSAPMSIKRKKDKKLCASFIIRDLRLVFRDQEEKGNVKFVDVDPVMANGKLSKRYGIQFTTTGIIEGMRLSGQTVKLNSQVRDNTKPMSAAKVVKDHFNRESELNKSLDGRQYQECTVSGESEDKNKDSKPDAVDPNPDALEPKPDAVDPNPESVNPKPDAVDSNPDTKAH